MTIVNLSRLCPFCESSCGLRIKADLVTNKIISIKGDLLHPASKGFICAKSQGLSELREDPDRVTKPLLRKGSEHIEIEWDEALDRAAYGLNRIRQRDGIEGLGIYLGNPSAHNAGISLGMMALVGAMPAMMVSAASIDSFPRFLVSLLMYGNQARVPVPDITYTDFFLIFGANPMVSNGSMMGAPGMPHRLKSLRERGGKLVVVDPRKTETAAVADQHVAVRPGSDALLLLAMINTLFAENLVQLKHLEPFTKGLESLRDLAVSYVPEKVAELTAVSAQHIRQLAIDFGQANRAVAYGRVGTCCQPFGSLATWLIDCLNVLTGNLDKSGGALFPRPAVPSYAMHLPFENGSAPYGILRSRVSNTPAIGNSFPTQVLWEEIDTLGKGQIRGLLTVAGNPVLSNANANRVNTALKQLEFMVSVDFYVNETSRHADVILPPVEHLKHAEMTTVYNEWMLENVLAYSPPVFAKGPDELTDWDILTALGSRLAGTEHKAFIGQSMEGIIDYLAPLLPKLPRAMSKAEMLEISSEHGGGVEQLYDLLIRGGDYGDGYGYNTDGISLGRLKAQPSGINLGPMVAGRFPAAVDTPDKKIDLLPPQLTEDLLRLEQAVAAGRFTSDQFTLINRRHIRSNNSWMHNLHALVKGPERHQAWIHPDDAAELGITEGDLIKVTSRVGEVVLPAQLNTTMLRRVISIPHGWGQVSGDVKQRLATSRITANVNQLSDDAGADKPSGNAAFNGLQVSISRV